jgi:positive regulator of sigma E activity
MAPTADEIRRRRIGLILIACALVLFLIQMIALVLGYLEVALSIFLVYAVGWFILRSYQRRTGRIP